MNDQIPVIIGPTASGKSKFSVINAKKMGASIISADAFQVYEDFNIGTGKLTHKEMDGVKHHLIGHIHPESPYSVQLFLDDVTAIKNQASAPLIICGGSAMYLKALLYGYQPLFRLPEQEKPIGTAESLWQKLFEIDPELAKKTPQQNRSRVQRYLELYLIYKRPPSQLFKSSKTLSPGYTIFGMAIERTHLKDTINTRVDQMIQNGLVDEVNYLMKKYNHKSPAFNAIGYREVRQYLQQVYDKDTMIQTIKNNTFHYAKRQMTWFKTFDHVQWISRSSI